MPGIYTLRQRFGGALIGRKPFLQRCRDTNTLPCCVEVKHHLNTKAARRILRRTSEALLRERVRHTRHSLHLCSEELLRIHLELGAKLNATDWDTIETITHDSSRNTETAVRETQIRKFEKLSDRQHPSSLGHGPEKDRSVINFTDYQLTNAHISILSKGLNFAIAPTKIPKEEIVTEVEYAIRKLPKGDADEIREDVARILRNARPPKMNITGAERRALSDLRGNENILILPADKGNSTVLMKRGDYEMKISRMREDSTYRKLRSDPTAKAERDTRALIKNSTIPREHQTRLFPSAAKPPRLYGLPKVHKEGVPLRPIVSQIDGPTYRLSKYLAQSLQPYVGQTSSFVRDSTHFIEILKKITISPNDILVSFDVASLFTNVPIQESVDIIKELTKSGIPEDHPQLIEYCLRNSYFLWSGSFFEQREGAAMGSPLSPLSLQSAKQIKVARSGLPQASCSTDLRLGLATCAGEPPLGAPGQEDGNDEGRVAGAIIMMELDRIIAVLQSRKTNFTPVRSDCSEQTGDRLRI
ncbi:uncharacterized protein [Hetaerina americana]|uniref:uncharacterized protein n=1 Tax=Hetaerina americana TaxID=62018 RepID=UPI003A7F2123